MVKRIAPSRIIWFCLLAACGALCQSESPSADFVYRDGSNSPELQLPVSRTWKSLPDTPSVTQAKEFRRFFGEAHSPLTLVAVGADARAIRKTILDHVKAAPQPSFAAHYKAMSIEKGFSGFLGRHLYPSLLKRNPGYHPSTGGSLMGRATYAASRILITPDDYGKNRLNTSYFLGVHFGCYFGCRTHDSQCMTLTQTEFCVELLFNTERECKVEILASEQEVLADGGTFKLDVSALDVGTYEAEIRCAASDVANQHELAVSQVLSENVLMLRHPRIKGSQRLFQ